MLRSLYNKAFAVAALAVCIGFTSCSDDNDDTPSYVAPTTYNFDNVDYSGQTQRMDMLDELNTYVKTGNNGAVLDAQLMKNMYANSGNPFNDASLNSSDKQLKDKTIATSQATIEGYFDAVAAASLSAGAPASNGTAGILTTTEGQKYLVDANGFEYGQLIQKGLMGAVFYFQAVEGYLSAEKIGPGVDNTTVTPGKGTTMEHHWDEAFGYFGAPKDFPTNTTGIRYWANYSNKVTALLNSNETMMTAFIVGRAAISVKDMQQKDAAAAIIRNEWERIVAASAILELNAAKSNIADQAKKSHYLSEAIGFIMSLRYKTDRKLTNAQYEQVMNYIGPNLYVTNGIDINNAINVISTAYDMDAIKNNL